MTRTTLLALAVLPGLACRARLVASPDADLRSAPPVTVSLRVGQTMRFHGVEVAFAGVPRDSRCPVDVVCVSAGNAVAEITVGPEVGLGPTYLLLLNTTEGAHDGTALDVRVVLLELLPEPVSTHATRPEDYVATLWVGGADAAER